MMDWQNQYGNPEEYNPEEPEIEEIHPVTDAAAQPAAIPTQQPGTPAPNAAAPVENTACAAASAAAQTEGNAPQEPVAPGMTFSSNGTYHGTPQAAQTYTAPPTCSAPNAYAQNSAYTTPPTYSAPPTYNTTSPVNAKPPKRKKKPKEKKSHLGVKIACIALVCALLGSIGGGALVGYMMRDTAAQPETKLEAPKTPQKKPTNEEFQTMLTTNPEDGYMTPAQIYEQYVDSVVGITNESTVTNYYGQISSTASSGSGFVITADGYIVSNYHVIEGASSLTVTLHNGESYDAEVVGYDAGNDVSLLKIDATGLTVAPLGDSDTLRVGDAVAAIGNPLGELDFSMSVGYISSLDRVINTDGKPINMLQTDTAINPGNSGGPLFDLHGNVIGITTAKYSGSTNSGASIEGIGFAIPINDVKAIVSDLQQYGYVTGQPYIGVTIGDISSSYMNYYEYPSSAYIDSVVPGSCGEEAGLQRGDIITGIGDYKIASYTDVVVALKNFSSGDSTTITIYRNEHKVVLDITFDEKKPTEEQPQEEQQQQIPGFDFGDLFP